MIETFELRPYQREAIDKLYAAYARGVRRPALVIPTGGGKTVIGTHPVADAVEAGGRVLWLAHRTELIEQAEEAIKRDSSGMSVGVLQAQRREVDRQVIVASVQTAVRPGALSLLRGAGLRLIVIDECHHAVAPSYLTILRELGAYEAHGPLVLGLTATLDRTDGLALGDVWEEVAHTIELQELIRLGFLLPPRGIRVKVDGLDLRGIKRSRSESGLDDHAVAQAMTDSLAPAAIARAVLEHCPGRKGVAFLPTVDLSKEQARVFAEHGLHSVHIDADTPKQVRREIWRQARAGRYDVVCNVGIATEGTDVPIWSFVVMGRLTSSSVLFTQMLGRGLRLAPGQRDCVVLDVAGVTGRHRIRTLADLMGADRPEDIPDELAEFFDIEDDVEIDDTPSPRSDDPEPAVGADGALTAELIDLFSASHTAWQRSPRGVWFLPTGDGRAVVLAPGQELETYDVLWTDGALVHEDSVPLDAAMSWGERAAKAAAKPLSLEKAAPWRSRKTSRADRLAAIYGGARPDDVLDAGGLAAVRDARWAAEAVDTMPAVAQVSPAGYWTT